jgi:rSAM/selenodomain-associated transferase 2
MPAPISIVIPTLNAEAGLHACLVALSEGLEAGLIRELIVSDGGSTDKTLEIADAWGAHILQGPASRGGQLKAGCAAATGQWLLALHADTVLSAGWTAAAARHLGTQNAGWFDLRFDQGGRVVAAWANLRSRFGLPYGDQGLLVPRGLYTSVGGYPDIPLMEDVALARALKGRLQRIEAQAITSSARYRKTGWLKRGSRNLLLLIRYFMGASPDRLARAYRKS